MRCYLIGYNTRKPGHDYGSLISAIKRIADGYWHSLESTWLIGSQQSATEICNALTPYLDGNDKLLVLSLDSPAASTGFAQDESGWLKSMCALAEA